MPTLVTMLFIFLGGGLGTLARYAVSEASRSGGVSAELPLATLFVNVLGCFLIGVLAQWAAVGWGIREDVRLALMVGVLGGFTTFSSFGLESVKMWGDGHQVRAVAYVLLSNVLGIGAAAAGLALGAQREAG